MIILSEKTAKRLFDYLVLDDAFLVSARFGDKEDLLKVVEEKCNLVRDVFGFKGFLRYIKETREMSKDWFKKGENDG